LLLCPDSFGIVVRFRLESVSGFRWNVQTEIIVHRSDGTIRSKDSYGKDPFPPEIANTKRPLALKARDKAAGLTASGGAQVGAQTSQRAEVEDPGLREPETCPGRVAGPAGTSAWRRTATPSGGIPTMLRTAADSQRCSQRDAPESPAWSAPVARSTNDPANSSARGSGPQDPRRRPGRCSTRSQGYPVPVRSMSARPAPARSGL